MSKSLRRTVLASLVAAALAVMSTWAPAQSESTPVIVENAWLRKPPPGLDSVAVYFTVKNPSKQDAVIVGVRSSAAMHAMIHESSTVDGQSRMRMQSSVKVAAGKSVAFAPEGLHVMLTGLAKTPEVGQKVPLTLELDHGGVLQVLAIVRPLDAK